MPTTFASYDLDQNGTISPAEWDAFYGNGAGGRGANGGGTIPPEGPYYTGNPGAPAAPGDQLTGTTGGPGGGGSDEFGIQDILDFFSQITGAFGDSGFEFTPEMLESFGVILPAMGMYSEFAKADYQNDALDFMKSELGLKQQELDLAKEQMAFESGPAWDWYVNEFFPMSMENQRLEWETQRGLMEGQLAQSGEETLQAKERTAQSREGTTQAREQTEQSKIASEIAKYQALQQIGLRSTNRTTGDGRSVRGNGITYGYGS
jgi:hypothetical protein